MLLRPATGDDVEQILDVQQPGAALGLGHIFPQDEHPFPRARIGARWRAEIADPAVAVHVCTRDDGAVEGFAAVRGHELLHFGTAVPTWGTGLASCFHDALLEVVAASVEGSRLTLRVFEENGRARRFYAEHGWRPTGRSSRTSFPPHPVLLEHERFLTPAPR